MLISGKLVSISKEVLSIPELFREQIIKPINKSKDLLANGTAGIKLTAISKVDKFYGGNNLDSFSPGMPLSVMLSGVAICFVVSSSVDMIEKAKRKFIKTKPVTEPDSNDSTNSFMKIKTLLLPKSCENKNAPSP
jgi:hypothetical protein